MKLLRGFNINLPFEAGCVATIGNFDGVHIGHQAILRRVREEKQHRQLPAVVFLFEPQPAEYFQQLQAPARLYGLREKIHKLRQFDIDYVVCLKFDAQLAAMLPEAFAHTLLNRFNPRCLLVGSDFRFGQHRAGDGQLLTKLAADTRCEVHLFNQFLYNNVRVSSTQIRRLLQMGELSAVLPLLGMPFFFCARVVHGRGIGRTLGIPTANLNIRRKVLPLSGVFAVRVRRQNGELCHGIANLGCRPTLGGGKATLEVHLFQFNQTIYGEWLEVDFLYKLRNEKKFACLDDLVTQIRLDIQQAQSIQDDMPNLAFGESYKSR